MQHTQNTEHTYTQHTYTHVSLSHTHTHTQELCVIPQSCLYAAHVTAQIDPYATTSS